MIEKYEKYLKIVDSNLDKFFEQQKAYIFCKEGCSMCCEAGSYPLSRIEFDYIMEGYETLPDELKEKVSRNIQELKEKKLKFGQGKFLHACPFLVDKKCSVYKYRALICRSYGLISVYYTENGESRYKLPYCIDQGLNYNSVYDEELGTLTSAKWKETGFEVEPVAHNVDITYLVDNEITQELNLRLGPSKFLVDWFD